jgi:hypothetical protein
MLIDGAILGDEKKLKRLKKYKDLQQKHNIFGV